MGAFDLGLCYDVVLNDNTHPNLAAAMVAVSLL